jgi:hypothetical protein
MKSIKPTIVVALFNRKKSAQRLLNSLSNAEYPINQNVNLVISIDNDRNKNLDVRELADEFSWKFGDKEVIFHPKNLGLKDHFNFCGDLTEKYGSIIFLEDDLFVSRFYYDYALQALDFYKDEEEVAGISLYNYNRLEHRTNPWPFIAMDDGFDNYFLQQASWGQIWSYKMWKPYKDWYTHNGRPEIINSIKKLSRQVRRWPATSWKKNFIAYMVLNDKYYVFPRIGLATNFDDPGLHREGTTVHLQVPQLINQKSFQFSKFSESLSVYDSYYELLPVIYKKLNPELTDYIFDVDLYGDKDIELLKEKPWALSYKKGKHIVRSFDLRMKPHELNIIFKIDGNKIFLSDTPTMSDKQSSDVFLDFWFYYFRGAMHMKEIVWFINHKIKKKTNSFITKHH